MFNFFKKKDDNAPLVFCGECKHCMKYDLSTLPPIKYKGMAVYVSDINSMIDSHVCNVFTEFEEIEHLDYFKKFKRDEVIKYKLCEKVNKKNDCKLFEQK